MSPVEEWTIGIECRTRNLVRRPRSIFYDKVVGEWEVVPLWTTSRDEWKRIVDHGAELAAEWTGHGEVEVASVVISMGGVPLIYCDVGPRQLMFVYERLEVTLHPRKAPA